MRSPDEGGHSWTGPYQDGAQILGELNTWLKSVAVVMAEPDDQRLLLRLEGVCGKLEAELAKVEEFARRQERIYTIIHELSAASSAIRANASVLQRRISELPEEVIRLKLDDLILDSEMLHLEVSKLNRFCGAPSISRFEKTVVFRDIILKTVRQLKPMITERGFDVTKIEYDVRDIPRLILYIDRAELNQVVFNVLINSISYAEDDASKFAIRIAVDETDDYFNIKFRDWGIGIKNGFETQIFEEGFRTPEAQAKFVGGSGLGLTISRQIMRSLRGDLVLANCFKPTEFQVILPKKLKETPGGPSK